jgi:hypothetical protein
MRVSRLIAGFGLAVGTIGFTLGIAVFSNQQREHDLQQKLRDAVSISLIFTQVSVLGASVAKRLEDSPQVCGPTV